MLPGHPHTKPVDDDVSPLLFTIRMSAVSGELELTPLQPADAEMVAVLEQQVAAYADTLKVCLAERTSPPALPSPSDPLARRFALQISASGTGTDALLVGALRRARPDLAAKRAQAMAQAFLETEEPTCLKDGAGRLLAANRAYERLRGLSSLEYVGKTPVELFGLSASSEAALDQACLAEQTEKRSLTLILDRTRSIREMTISSRSFAVADDSGAVEKRIITTYHDRAETDRLIDELQQKTAILNSALGIFFVINWKRMRFQEVSAGACLALGYEEREFLALDPSEIFPQFSALRLQGQLRDIAAEPNGSAQMRTILMQRGGGIIESEITFKLVQRQHDSHMAAIVKDITQQMKSEDDLRRANRQLRLAGAINHYAMELGDEGKLLQSILDFLAGEAEFSGAYCIVEREGSTGIRTLYRGSGSHGDLRESAGDFANPDEFLDGFLGYEFEQTTLRKNQPRLERSPQGMPTWRMPTHGAWIALPLIGDSQRLGIVTLFAKSPEQVDGDEMQLLESLASEIAYAILNQRREVARVRAEQQIARRLKIESAISSFSHTLLKSSDFALGIRESLPDLAQAIEAERVFLYETAGVAKGEELRFVRSSDYSRNKEAAGTRSADLLRLDDESARWIRACPIPNGAEQRAGSMPQRLRRQLDLRKRSRFLAFPVFCKGELVAFIGIALRNAQAESDGTIYEILSIAASLVEELYNRVRSDREMRMLATAINNSGESVLITGNSHEFADSSITFANESFCRTFGRPASQLLGLSPLAALGIASNEFGGGDASSLRAHRVHLTRADQSSFTAELKVYPISGANPSSRHFIAIIVDVTEKEEMATKLAFANKMESIGQLSAGIAHEINTPSQFVGDNLNFIGNAWSRLTSTLKALADDAVYESFAQSHPEANCLPPKKLTSLLENVPDAIADAIEGSERITSIVRAMKEFSHPERRKVLGDLNKCVLTAVTVARNEWKYVSNLETALAENLPLAEFMPGEINQVLLNLIVNAAHAIEQKHRGTCEKGLIRISTTADARCVRLTISDTGCGIPEEHKNSVFNPFFTTKEVGKGTGQGLFMAHAIIEQEHGGRIWFESQLGVGASFHVELPLKTNENESD